MVEKQNSRVLVLAFDNQCDLGQLFGLTFLICNMRTISVSLDGMPKLQELMYVKMWRADSLICKLYKG